MLTRAENLIPQHKHVIFDECIEQEPLLTSSYRSSSINPPNNASESVGDRVYGIHSDNTRRCEYTGAPTTLPTTNNG